MVLVLKSKALYNYHYHFCPSSSHETFNVWARPHYSGIVGYLQSSWEKLVKNDNQCKLCYLQ